MFSADLGGYTPSGTPAATDPPFQKVALLLHGDGTNGAQNNTFVDSSSNSFTITRTGNVAQGTFSPFSLAEGQWSNYFDGSSYLRMNNSSAFDFGSGDWTVEFWIYPTGSTAGTILTNNSNGIGWSFDCNPSPNNRIRFTIDGGATKQLDANGVNNNTWTHFAMTRSGSNLYMYVNGTRVTSSTTAATIANTNTYNYIGNGYGSALYGGYLSNVRIVKGSALYTGASFTVSTTPLTAVSGTSFLTCQSNRFVDNSSNNLAITALTTPKVTAFSPFAPSAAYSAGTNGGSGYFDGSGDYLTVPSMAFASDFTAEMWVYPTALSGTQSLLDQRDTSTWQGWQLYLFGNQVYSGSAQTTSSPMVNGAWQHIAFTRSGTITKIYVNGTLQATGSDSTNYPARTMSIGSDRGVATLYKGYIGDLRITNAVVYTSNFTPPTAPLTAVSGTQLLLNCVNAGIYDNSGKNDIETVGDAQISTSVKKYGTGSIVFDGTGDYLVNNGNTDSFAFGAGDWTIEFWLYISSLPAGNTYIYDCRPTSTQGVYPTIYITSTGNLVFFVSSLSRINASAAISTGAWQHVAICKSSGSTKAFVNGTQVGSTYTDTNTYICGANRPSIASAGYTLNANLLTGYIDDLRITKGQALYTSNFTPPTQAFPNV